MSFVTKFLSWIKSQYLKIFPSVRETVNIGISLIENIKKYVDNPGVDVLTAIIPGNIDDNAKLLLRAYLPKLLAKLLFIKGALDNEQIVEFIEKVQKADDDAKALLTHGIASLVNFSLTDELGSFGQSFVTTEVVFKSEEAKTA